MTPQHGFSPGVDSEKAQRLKPLAMDVSRHRLRRALIQNQPSLFSFLCRTARSMASPADRMCPSFRSVAGPGETEYAAAGDPSVSDPARSSGLPFAAWPTARRYRRAYSWRRWLRTRQRHFIRSPAWYSALCSVAASPRTRDPCSPFLPPQNPVVFRNSCTATVTIVRRCSTASTMSSLRLRRAQPAARLFGHQSNTYLVRPT